MLISATPITVRRKPSLQPCHRWHRDLPVNVNGNWNMRASLRYQKRWKKRFNLSARTGANFSQSVALVNEGKSEEPDRSVTHNTSYNANLRLGYQPKWGGFDLQGDWRYRHATNQLRSTSNYTRSYNFSLNTYAELPLGFLVKSDAAYSFRNGTNIKRRRRPSGLELGASWRFLKRSKPSFRSIGQIFSATRKLLSQCYGDRIDGKPYLTNWQLLHHQF